MNFCVIIVISCCIGTGFGRITEIPRNVVALVGNNATLKCCNGVGNHSLHWKRLSLNTREFSDIYLGENGGFVDDFRGGRYNINNGSTSGCYNLMISDIQLNDAGTYTCADEYDVKQSASAEVTILESFACYEVFPNKDIYTGINSFGLEPDIIQLMCSIKYRGRFIPEMQWKWQNLSKISNFKAFVTNLNIDTASSIAIIFPAKEVNRNKITCFVQSPGDEDLSRNTVNWTSKSFKVNYATFNKEEVVNCTTEGLSLECNTNCSISTVRGSNGSLFCRVCFSSDAFCVDLAVLEGEPEGSSANYKSLPTLQFGGYLQKFGGFMASTIGNNSVAFIKIMKTAVFVDSTTWSTAEVVTIIAVMGFVIAALCVAVGILIYRLRKIQELLDRILKGICDICKSRFPFLTQSGGILEGTVGTEMVCIPLVQVQASCDDEGQKV